MREGVAAADIEDGRECRTPGTRVHTDGHMQAGRLLIHREKIGVVQGAVALNAPEEEANSAVLFGKVISSIEASIALRGGTTTHRRRPWACSQTPAMKRL